MIDHCRRAICATLIASGCALASGAPVVLAALSAPTTASHSLAQPPAAAPSESQTTAPEPVSPAPDEQPPPPFRARQRVTSVPLQLSQLEAPNATAERRESAVRRMREMIQEAATTSPLVADDEDYTDALYYATMLSPDAASRQTVRTALRAYGELPDEEYQRLALESAYGVDPQAFLAEMSVIAEGTSTPKHFAMASLYLQRALPDAAAARRDALERMERKFPDWSANPVLLMLGYDLAVSGDKSHATTPTLSRTDAPARPSLSQILSTRFAAGWPVAYSLQRRDRSQPGLTLVRRPDGRFHRNEDGALFRISHLARSRTDLPGYITNGNTPQGVFSVAGLGISRERAIGRTPYLRTLLPFETTPDRFLHNPELAGTTWSVVLYRSLLPDSPAAASDGPALPAWRDWFPMFTAWHAGAAGRFDILSHGTTVDPSFYSGRSWFPGAPTSGCICAKEIWDPVTGRALHSDQLALVHAWLAASGIDVPYDRGEGEIGVADGPRGFFVVIELDDKPQPVSLDEVLTEVLEAERISRPVPPPS